MSDKNKNNIFYKPELNYEKSYETEGRINSSIIGENNQVSENIIDEFNGGINIEIRKKRDYLLEKMKKYLELFIFHFNLVIQKF